MVVVDVRLPGLVARSVRDRGRLEHRCARPLGTLVAVPLINAVRSPTRFAIVAALGLAMLLAGALAALGERWPRQRRAIGVAALLLLVVELSPAPRTLYSAEYSPLSQNQRGRLAVGEVLNLPFGVRDGTSSAGEISAGSQFEQTLHGKPLIGGYLSRVSSRHLAAMTRRSADWIARGNERGPSPGDEVDAFASRRRPSSRTPMSDM